jgi:UDP-N-acetylglucosamine 2-epimerase
MEFGLLTIHRADNTDNLSRLCEILEGLNQLEYPILFPVHPRTRKTILDNQLEGHIENLTLIDPVPYAEFLALVRSAKFVATDSGGVQQEAAIFKKAAITIRDNTEWVETLGEGGNRLVKANKDEITDQVSKIISNCDGKLLKNPFELGAASKSLNILIEAKKTGDLGYRKSNFFDDSYDEGF